jgi:O-antigen/teichoic acid export membrane protein
MTISLAPNKATVSVDDAPRSTSRNFRSILIGRLFSALSIWLALVALTKMSDPATVGLYALAQAICIPVAEISKMSLREIRSADTEGIFQFGDYMGMRILATLAGFAVMVAAGVLQSESAAMLAVIVLYGLARCSELISDMIYGLFQAHERMEYIGWSLCILGPLSLAMLVLGYWLTGSLVVAVLGQLLAHLAVLSLYDFPHGRWRAATRRDEFKPRWRKHALYGLARRALPLTFASVLIIIALYFPRMAVEHQLGLTGLGLFAAILALAMAPDRLVNALGIAASVRLATFYSGGQIREFLRLLLRLTAGVAIVGSGALAICIVAGEDILRVVYTDVYASEHHLLVLLVAASLLRSIANVLRYGVIATRRFWWLGLQNGVAALVAIVGCVALIPEFGLSGAGATMVIVFAAQLVIAAIALLLAIKNPTSENGP